STCNVHRPLPRRPPYRGKRPLLAQPEPAMRTLAPASPPRPWRAPAVVLLVLGAALAAACSEQPPAAETVRPAIVAQPQVDGSRVELFHGVVRTRHEAALGFRIAGKLASRAVEVGDRVEAGQVLAQLDPE